MNRTFKTIWSAARQQYIVSDEKHMSRGKAAKATMAAVAVAAAFAAGSAFAAYMPVELTGSSLSASSGYQDPGKIGDKGSWETEEYKKDWGLTAMKASSAYALGYHGQGVALGVMDSGALLQKHPELAGDRFHASHATGEYGSTGDRYQDGVNGVGDVFENGDYEKGDKFDIDGNWIGHVNDTHGTHVTGTVGANRDGSEFHGVSWGSEIWVGNTGGTDNTNYGMPQDYNFFYAGWKSLADNLVAANGAERGGVINNSFGTNLRINEGGTSLPANTTAETEYEYFLFKQRYGDDPSFVDAAWDAVKGTNVVQVMTTGNRNMDMPYYRALYPYFNPEAEQNWIAVAGLQKDGVDAEGRDKYKWVDGFNQAGNAKWWTVVAPGSGIYSSIVYDDHYEATDDEHKLGDAGYASYSGTSMAAPHVTGAMGVLMSRYQDMSAVQVRDVLFTTANHKNADGSNFTGWTAAEGEVDEIYGWGMPDLEKGMYGPGQLLGKFDYNMRTTALDVWSNDISQVALDQRKAEDLAWMELTNNGTDLDAEDYELGGADIPDVEDATIDPEDARKWRAEYYAKRAESIKYKLENGLYDGSLVKRGQGTLVLTGNNTYRGGTTVEEGTLWGFYNSFGVTETETKAVANGKVTVNGGSFGIMNSYTDEFTQTGTIRDDHSDHSVDVAVKDGGTYLLSAGEEVSVGNISFEEGAKISVGSANAETLKGAVDGVALETKLKADNVTGLTEDMFSDDALAFFDTKLTIDSATGEITATTEVNEGSFTAYGSSSNAREIGKALAATKDGALFDMLLTANGEQVGRTYDSLGNDAFLNAQNALIVNTITMTRAVKDQAQGIGGARVAEMADGTARIWATGIGTWGDVDYGNSSIDNDFYAGLVGAEVDVCPAAKVGVFFGAGTSEFDGGKDGKLESDDIHFGMYAQTNIQDVVGLNFGFTYTQQDREGHRGLTVGTSSAYNKINNDAQIAQIFVEGAYTGFNTASYSVEPYVGFSWMHVQSDDFSESVAGVEIETNNENQNVEVTTLGIRGAIPFTVGSVAMSVKGDVNWMHFFGDTSAEALLGLGGSGVAKIEGGELDNMFGVGLGIEAQLTKTTTFGLSYTGAYDGDVSSTGLFANVRFAF